MRKSGILLPVTSLPSDYGIGCFSKSAYDFVDFLKASGQSYWQILPLGPTSFGDSPYQSFSTFAGNPYMIDLNALIKDGLLSKEECDCALGNYNGEYIDYKRQYEARYTLLEKAYEKFSPSAEYEVFAEGNAFWLEDYSLFMAVKKHFNDASLYDWDEDIRLRKSAAMENYRTRLKSEIGFYKFIQFNFYKQWKKLKSYANSNNISIIGDIPIYVSYDSADVWANPELFELDESGLPINVAGCPPDGFSEKGQLWGNPLYNWDNHKKTNFEWWIKRMHHAFGFYDVLRIDHFRGFDEYYSIKYGSVDAIDGEWRKGPGFELFKTVKDELGEKNVIAEDLGFITESVRDLLRDCGFPGMKILEFAFDSRDTGETADYLPHNYPENCVAYTGTHDNQTVSAWFKTISESERLAVRSYLCDRHTPDSEIHLPLIALIMRSRASLCIIPIQDWLGLSDSSRINTPSTVGQNWRWRIKKDQLTEELQNEIYNMTKMYGRL